MRVSGQRSRSRCTMSRSLATSASVTGSRRPFIRGAPCGTGASSAEITAPAARAVSRAKSRAAAASGLTPPSPEVHEGATDVILDGLHLLVGLTGAVVVDEDREGQRAAGAGAGEAGEAGDPADVAGLGAHAAGVRPLAQALVERAVLAGDGQRAQEGVAHARLGTRHGGQRGGHGPRGD